MSQIEQGVPGANVLPDGDFEAPPNVAPEAWIPQEPQPMDQVDTSARRVTDNPKKGKQCLMLEIKPKTLDRPWRATAPPTRCPGTNVPGHQ